MKQLPLKIHTSVIKGKGRGKKMGIPTLNFAIPSDLDLSFGVYAGRLKTEKSILPAAIHYGPRPVFDEDDPSLEVFILDDFNEDITRGELEFIKYIRDVISFVTPTEMLAQIDNDVIEIKKALNTNK